MAQRVQVLIVDDVDGTTDADETVTFALDGVNYEIDLSSDNAAQLRDDFAQWIGHARRAGGSRRSGSRGSSRGSSGGGGAKRKDLSAIREWARENGYEVSDRGRISGAVQEAYDAAHA
jgi:hypothetical protein